MTAAWRSLCHGEQVQRRRHHQTCGGGGGGGQWTRVISHLIIIFALHPVPCPLQVAKLPRHSALKVVGEPEWLNANLATALCGSLPAAAAAGPSTSVAVSPSPSCKGLLRHTLRDLEIAGCCIVDVDCAPLAAATALTRLVLEQLWELRDVGFLQGCGAGLRSLTLNDCPALASLAGLSSCPGLESLYLSALEARPSLSPLSRLTQLGELSLMGRSSDDLAPLAHCTALHTVRAWQLSAAPEQLAPLGRLPGLRHLEFRDSTALIDVTPLSSLTCLSHLDLSLGRDWRGSGPTDLRPLSSCTALVYLSVDLSYNGSLESVAPLAALTRLERLRLAGCSALRWVAPLVACTALRHLCLFSVARQPVPDDIWELDACRALEVVAVDKLGRIDLRGRTVSKALVDTVRSRYRQMVEWIASKWGCWPQLVARADRVHHNTAPTVAAAGGGSSGTHDPDCFFHSWGPG